MVNLKSKKPKHLVIGAGEVGKALWIVLSKGYNTTIGDKDIYAPYKYDFIHICFPYSKNFVQQVRVYKKKYLTKRGICIIHSTVPIGISRKCDAVHSPIRGIHPNLVKGIETFVKFVGGKNAIAIARVFEVLGIKCRTTPKQETTEAMKLWDTTQYGVSILLEKEIWKFCKKNGVIFDEVYTFANATYNDGYERLGKSQYKRYILEHKEGKIGGHCVVQNCQFLNSHTAREIIRKNKLL